MFKFCEKGQKCSCWFDGWFGKDWGSCCKEHDFDYIFQRTKTKAEADKKFYKCLKQKAGLFIALVMYVGVKYIPVAKYEWNRYKKRKRSWKPKL